MEEYKGMMDEIILCVAHEGFISLLEKATV